MAEDPEMVPTFFTVNAVEGKDKKTAVPLSLIQRLNLEAVKVN